MDFPAITELVPHAAPMLALEELCAWEDGFARARLVVRSDGPFAHDGTVEGLAALEWMAQGVAACVGMEAWQGGGLVRVGMVVACRRLALARPTFQVGEELVVEVRRVHGNESASHFETEVRDAAGERVAQATLTLVHAEAPG